MANPCDKRVQQLTASLNTVTKVVEGLNAQVTAQALELDEANRLKDAAWIAADIAGAKVLQQQAEIERLQALLNQQPQPGPSPEPTPTPEPPAESFIQPESIPVDVGGTGGTISNEPRGINGD